MSLLQRFSLALSPCSLPWSLFGGALLTLRNLGRVRGRPGGWEGDFDADPEEGSCSGPIGWRPKAEGRQKKPWIGRVVGCVCVCKKNPPRRKIKGMGGGQV